MSTPDSIPIKTLLKRLRRYEIKIRKSLSTHQQGNMRSLFKGTGLVFEDLRPYQYGDDVRRIDWNVSAKDHGTYIKRFREDREQLVFFVLDSSGSQSVGRHCKWLTVRELCGVLALSALHESSQVGLLVYGSKKEVVIKPGQGPGHLHRLLHALYTHPIPMRAGTDLAGACRLTMDLMRHKSLIFVISDFVDQGYITSLRALGRKHDVVLIHVRDQEELSFPALGLIPIKDAETNRLSWIQSTSKGFRARVKDQAIEKERQLRQLALGSSAHYVSLVSGASYIAPLVKLFKVRNQSSYA